MTITNIVFNESPLIYVFNFDLHKIIYYLEYVSRYVLKVLVSSLQCPEASGVVLVTVQGQDNYVYLYTIRLNANNSECLAGLKNNGG